MFSRQQYFCTAVPNFPAVNDHVIATKSCAERCTALDIVERDREKLIFKQKVLLAKSTVINGSPARLDIVDSDEQVKCLPLS